METNTPPADAARDYRSGLERAMTLVWTQKQKHSVISPEYFALAKIWDELYREANAKDAH